MGKLDEGSKDQAISITASEEIRKGSFANSTNVLHSSEDFRLDFYYISGEEGVLCARVIVTPPHMKRILNAMNENFKKYEDQFGPVKENVVEVKRER